MTRKRATPFYLSLTRKIYTYVGGTSLFTLITQKYGLTAEDLALIVQLYLLGGVIIQFICDAKFRKEKPEPFPPEKYLK